MCSEYLMGAILKLLEMDNLVSLLTSVHVYHPNIS